MLATTDDSRVARIDQALSEKSDGVLETVAAACDAALLDVLRRLPEGHVRLRPGADFEDIWTELTRWGDVLFIVHTADIVLECKGRLPPGSSGHGYFNIHDDGPIGGHIRAANCQTIALVDRLFHARRSCSIQFLNTEGNAMFKVFVPRNAAKDLDPVALERFGRLFKS